MKKNIILFIAVIMSFGCHKDYNIYNENDFKAKIVLHSFASPDSILRVFVTKTVVPEQLDTNIFIKNALVELYEDDVLVENLGYFEKREILYEDELDDYQQIALIKYYKSNYILKQNHSYKIIVKAIGQEVSAEFSFPNKNYDVEFSKSDFICDTFQIENSFYDYTAEGNAIIKINTNEQKYFMISFLSNTWDVDYDNIDDYESVFPDSVYYQLIRYFNLSSNRPYQEENNQYVYAPLPCMKFGSYSDGSNIFTNNLGNNELSISGKLAFSGIKRDDEEIYIKYRVFEISEEMYNYYLSREKYNNSDDNPFVEPVNIYSNVANGFGVVATYNVYEDSLKIDITGVK